MPLNLEYEHGFAAKLRSGAHRFPVLSLSSSVCDENNKSTRATIHLSIRWPFRVFFDQGLESVVREL